MQNTLPFLKKSLTMNFFISKANLVFRNFISTYRRSLKKSEILRNDAINDSKIEQTQHLSPIYAFCTAEEYELNNLFRNLHNPKMLADDVIYSEIPNIGSTIFFKNGTFVSWLENNNKNNKNLFKEDVLSIIKKYLSSCEISPLNVIESEEMHFFTSNNEQETTIKINEIIALRNNSAIILDKLAVSNGLADSVKLAFFENFMEQHISKIKDIPKAMQEGNKLPVNKDSAFKLRGELLAIRASVNLYGQLIDAPDFYWTEPRLENIYKHIKKCLDNSSRIAILNAKLDYASEIANVLSNHLTNQHSMYLEWGIIGLIAVEVVFELLHLINGYTLN